jgi:hypothetical protein
MSRERGKTRSNAASQFPNKSVSFFEDPSVAKSLYLSDIDYIKLNYEHATKAIFPNPDFQVTLGQPEQVHIFIGCKQTLSLVTESFDVSTPNQPIVGVCNRIQAFYNKAFQGNDTSDKIKTCLNDERVWSIVVTSIIEMSTNSGLHSKQGTQSVHKVIAAATYVPMDIGCFLAYLAVDRSIKKKRVATLMLCLINLHVYTVHTVRTPIFCQVRKDSTNANRFYNALFFFDASEDDPALDQLIKSCKTLVHEDLSQFQWKSSSGQIHEAVGSSIPRVCKTPKFLTNVIKTGANLFFGSSNENDRQVTSHKFTSVE